MTENENATMNKWSPKVETSHSRKIGTTLSLMVWAYEEAVDRSCKITQCLNV